MVMTGRPLRVKEVKDDTVLKMKAAGRAGGLEGLLGLFWLRFCFGFLSSPLLCSPAPFFPPLPISCLHHFPLKKVALLNPISRSHPVSYIAKTRLCLLVMLIFCI